MDAEHGSGSSKHLETRRVGSDGSWSSKGSEIYPEVIDGSGSSKHSETHQKVIDEAFVLGSDRFSPAKKLRSSSSSSSNSSLEDLFLVDTEAATKPGTSTASLPKPHEGTQPTLKDDEDDVLFNNSSKSEECDNGSAHFASSSPVSDVTNESMLRSVSPTQSPPVQVMDRSGEPEGYDPFRIPAAVFASRPTTPLEWSIASNESLFSIHVGNNSFSRDNIFLLGELGKSGELYKSGEPYKSEELYRSGELYKSGELISFSPPLPIPQPGRISVEMEKKLDVTGVENETIKDETRPYAKDQGESKLPTPTVSWTSSNMSHSHHSRLSNGSEVSTQSFAFPIKKCAWPSCHCSNCSWAFCYCWNCSPRRLCCHCWNCKWPSCYCSNCSWAFCYRWNCSPRRLCCHCWKCKWPSCYCSNCSWAFFYRWNCTRKSLTEGERSGSVKADAELQNPQPQHTQPEPSKVTSNSWTSSWFSCFPCLPRCYSCRCC